MDLEKIVEELNKQISSVDACNISSFLSEQGVPVDLTHKDRKCLEKLIRDYRTNPISAYSAACIYAFLYPDDALFFLRKRGVLSGYSRFKYREQCLNLFMELRDALNPENHRYVEQKSTARWLDSEYVKLDNLILDEITAHNNRSIKKRVDNQNLSTVLFMELLSFLEMIFRLKENQARVDKQILCLDEFDNYSMEEIGEAVSYLVSVFFDHFSIPSDRYLWIDAKYVLSEDIKNLVKIALKRNTLVEWEVLVDYFDYQIIDQNDNVFLISDGSLDLERSLRAGFIKNDLQKIVSNINAENKISEYISLGITVNKLYDSIGESIFLELGTIHFNKRYSMCFDYRIISLFAPKNGNPLGLYLEEINDLARVAGDMFLTVPELIDMRVTDHCTVRDIVVFKRFFIVTSLLQKQFFEDEKLLHKLGDVTELLRRWARSITPVFTYQELVKILMLLLQNKDKVDELIGLFTWRGEGRLDLQYTPIICADENRYFFAPYVLGASNLIRNVIVNLRHNGDERTNAHVGADKLEQKVEKAFADCIYEYKYAKNLKYKFNGTNGEIDFVAWKDNYLYVLECKNPILPTGSLELRTTYDYIVKATHQLDLSISAFQDTVFREKYFSAWGIPNKKWNIVPAIILGNRVFTINNGFRYPIRYARELDNILNKGILRSSFGVWRYWKEAQFTDEDLHRFLSEEDPLSSSIYESMKPLDFVLSVGRKQLRYKSFSLDDADEILKWDKYFEKIE